MYALAKNSKADYWNVGKRSEAINNILNEKIVSLEFAEMFLGNLLGSGISRYVFEDKNNSKQVVKINIGEANQNVIEWNVWQHVQQTKYAKWFAPIRGISRHGTIMFQDKIVQKGDYPKYIPDFFTDVKYANFGFIGKQIVCCDYAYNLLIEKGLKIKLVKADW